METETHVIDRDNHLYLNKVDLLGNSEEIVGFKMMCYGKVFECHLDHKNNSVFSVGIFGEDTW